jgi:hypothetical protein
LPVLKERIGKIPKKHAKTEKIMHFKLNVPYILVPFINRFIPDILFIVMLNVFMLSVITLSVIMLSVVEPLASSNSFK